MEFLLPKHVQCILKRVWCILKGKVSRKTILYTSVGKQVGVQFTFINTDLPLDIASDTIRIIYATEWCGDRNKTK